MTLKKGQVCFHSCKLVHGSRDNISPIRRLAIALHLQDETNIYRKAYKENGEQIVIGYDHVCTKDLNGDPDYTDDFLFPKIYTS